MILLCISLILDGYLSSFIPSNSVLLPKLTITAIYYLHQKYKKKPTTYLTILIVLGIIYDLLYTNIILFHSIVLYFIGKFIIYIKDKYNKQPSILGLILTITTYEIIIFLLINLFNISNTSLQTLILIIINSMLLNIIYLKIISFIQKSST